MAEEGTAAAQEAAAQQQFVTQRIYTKDISFESPMTPNVFRQEWKPAVNVDLNTKSSRVDEEGNHEVVLTLTITAKLEEQTAFLVEVQQAGIFFVAGIEGDALRQLLSTVAPTILFPYAREAIDNLVVKGGFPALMIAPVNFDALFRQAVAQQAAEAGEAGEVVGAGEGGVGRPIGEHGLLDQYALIAELRHAAQIMGGYKHHPAFVAQFAQQFDDALFGADIHPGERFVEQKGESFTVGAERTAVVDPTHQRLGPSHRRL